MDCLCAMYGDFFQPFWFYRADRQRDRITFTDADDRCTDATTVGVSKIRLQHSLSRQWCH